MMMPEQHNAQNASYPISEQRAGIAETMADIRMLMAGFPTGVSVVTAIAPDGHPWGMTCTSLCSVSLHPPILLVCLRIGSPTLNAVLEGGTFAVNLLHDQAQHSAELFASGEPNRFSLIAWTLSADSLSAGPHLVDSAHSIADCTMVGDCAAGDHTVVMGQVQRVTLLRAQRPLLYGLRHYAAWPGSTPDGPAVALRSPRVSARTPIATRTHLLGVAVRARCATNTLIFSPGVGVSQRSGLCRLSRDIYSNTLFSPSPPL
jgi:flavin reductase (NADH)